MMKIIPDKNLILELFKLFIICFLFGVMFHRIVGLEQTLATSYSKVKATKSHLFYFDNKNHLDSCTTLYWFLEKK